LTLPGASGTVKPRLDLFGRPIRRFQNDGNSGIEKFLIASERMLSPFRGRSTPPEDIVTKELDRLGVKGKGRPAIKFGLQQKRQGGVELNREELFEVRQNTGVMLHQFLDTIMRTETYQKHGDLGKSVMINSALSVARQVGSTPVASRAMMRVYNELAPRVEAIRSIKGRDEFLAGLRGERQVSDELIGLLYSQYVTPFRKSQNR